MGGRGAFHGSAAGVVSQRCIGSKQDDRILDEVVTQAHVRPVKYVPWLFENDVLNEDVWVAEW